MSDTPTDKKRVTVNTYNATAEAMAKKFNGMGARIEDIERGFGFVAKTNPKVLEIGCGNGRDAEEILKRTKNYLGIDISESMIRLAREHVPEGEFQVADIEYYTFPRELDLIFSFASLLHSDKDSVAKILLDAHNALNKEGIFYLSLKCGDYEEVIRTDEFGTRTFYLYTPQLIKEMTNKKFTVLFEETKNLLGQEWFIVVLQKKAF